MQEYISNQEFLELITLYKKGQSTALDKLVVLSEPLVKKMSTKYYSILMKNNIPLEDMKQECYLALISAINHFPLNEPCNYVSFVCSAMNYQMTNYFRYHTNRKVKMNADAGYIEFESMDKDKNSFCELADPYQDALFDEMESKINREYLKVIIQNMLDDILIDKKDISFLRDMYDLGGKSFSFEEICKKYNLSLYELVTKERILVLKLQNDKRLQEYLKKMDYTPSAAYHYGISRFKYSGMSSTEYIALKHIYAEENMMS